MERNERRQDCMIRIVFFVNVDNSGQLDLASSIIFVSFILVELMKVDSEDQSVFPVDHAILKLMSSFTIYSNTNITIHGSENLEHLPTWWTEALLDEVLLRVQLLMAFGSIQDDFLLYGMYSFAVDSSSTFSYSNGKSSGSI